MISRGGFVIAIIAALLSGISLGLIAGILCARYVMHGWVPYAFEHRHGMRPGGPPGPPPGVLRLEQALDLSPAQKDSVEAIVERSHARFEAMRDSLRHQIETQLTPAQRQKWQQEERRMGPWRGRPWPRPHDGDRP